MDNNQDKRKIAHIRVNVSDRCLVNEDLISWLAYFHEIGELHIPAAPNVVGGLTRDEHGFTTSASHDLLSMSETGETLSDVPITRSKSTKGLSSMSPFSNSLESFSPKNVISGYKHHVSAMNV